jgi:hypothetical protein
MSKLEELKKEMRGLEERFLEKDGQNLSAILDPSRIPTDMAALASLEQGRVDSPDNANVGNDNTEIPKPESPDEKPPEEKEQDADVSEEDIKEMSAEEVKESLGLALEIAFECAEKAQMILKTLAGGQGKADLKDVIDQALVEKANDVTEEYIELVEYMEEIEKDTGSEEEPEEPEDDEKDSDEKPEGEEEPEEKSDDSEEEEPEEEPEK